jgi:hypothetical protein
MTGHPETDAAGAAMADLQAASPAELPLPHTSVGGLDEMLGILSARGGRGDLPELAGRLSLEVDDLIPLTDAAQMPGFAEVDDAAIKLTLVGQQWAQAGPAADKKIFAEQARDRAPLVRTIVRALSEAPGGKLSRQFFLDLLEHNFTPRQEPSSTPPSAGAATASCSATTPATASSFSLRLRVPRLASPACAGRHNQDPIGAFGPIGSWWLGVPMRCGYEIQRAP